MVTYRRANKQYIGMTEEEVWSYLDSRSTMFVAFVREDGFPHVTPVWFVTASRRIFLRGQAHKVKFRLAHSAKVCCSLEDGWRYSELRGLVVWGRASLVTDATVIDRVQALIDTKYAGRSWSRAEVPTEWARQRATESRSYVEIEPEHVASWDNTKLVAARSGDGLCN